MAKPIDTRTLLIRGTIALGLSLAVNLTVLTVLLEADLVTPFDPLAYPPVALLTTVGVVGATVVYAVLTRRFDRPDRLFVRLALVVLVLSFVPDVALLVVDDAATVGAVTALAALHVTTAFVCIASLTGRLGP